MSGRLHLAATTTDAYSQGTALSQAAVQQVITSAVGSGRLPLDSNGIYLVLSSADVNQFAFNEAFCTQFCGWHDVIPFSGVNLKYGWIGDALQRCPSSCIAPENLGSSPNGNIGADGMASVITHELSETVTDPLLGAWRDPIDPRRRSRSACAWARARRRSLRAASWRCQRATHRLVTRGASPTSTAAVAGWRAPDQVPGSSAHDLHVHGARAACRTRNSPSTR